MHKDFVWIVRDNLNKYTSLSEGKKILVINNETYSMKVKEMCEHYNLPFINFECSIDELLDLDKVEQIFKEN